MVCVTRLKFEWCDQKDKKRQKVSLRNLFYEFKLMSWLFYGGGVVRLEGRLRIFDIEPI